MVAPWQPPDNPTGLSWLSEEARLAVEALGIDTSKLADDWNEILVDGRFVPVVGPVRYNNLASFAPKLVVGDTTRDSDDLMSARVYANWTGGGQKNRENSSTDQERFWYSTAYTRSVNQLSLNPEVVEYPDPSGATGTRYCPLGSLDGAFWGAWNERIHRFDPATRTWATSPVASLPAAPVFKAVEFDGELWVPCGTATARFNGTTVTTSAVIDAVALHSPDSQKLYALAADGQIHRYFNSAWETPNTDLKVREGTPRNLLSYTLDDNPVLHVVTSRGAWALDDTNLILYRTKLQIPPHPSGGRASAVWVNTANLYVSAGLGISQYNGGTVSPMGLDKDHGLPARNRGFIVDLEPELNGLYALIQGQTTVVEGDDTLAPVGPAFFDDLPLVPPVQAVSSLMYWTSFGWHTLWESSAASGLPSWTMVCAPSDTHPESYGLMWGYGGTCCYTRLPADWFAPLEQVQVRSQRYQSYGRHEQATFSANMETWPKTLSHAQIRVAHCDTGCRVVMSLKLDDAPGWTEIGSATAAGTYVFQLGPEIAALPGIGEGAGFDDLRVLVELYGDAASPERNVIVDHFSVKFTKEPLEGRSWQVNIPLPPLGALWKGRSAQEIADDLDYLTRPRRFISLTHQGRTFRVRTSYVSGTNITGPEGTMIRQLNIVEIRTGAEPYGIGETS